MISFTNTINFSLMGDDVSTSMDIDLTQFVSGKFQLSGISGPAATVSLVGKILHLQFSSPLPSANPTSLSVILSFNG